MNLFRTLGRQVEQFRQTAKGTTGENAGYQCRACNEPVSPDHDHCPECGTKKDAPASTEE